MNILLPPGATGGPQSTTVKSQDSVPHIQSFSGGIDLIPLTDTNILIIMIFIQSKQDCQKKMDKINKYFYEYMQVASVISK